MLKISRLDPSPGVVTLQLEGRVQGPWVEELRRACAQVLATQHRLILDLAEVSFIDLQGVALCHHLRDHNVLFLHGSLFVTEQLKGEA